MTDVACIASSVYLGRSVVFDCILYDNGCAPMSCPVWVTGVAGVISRNGIVIFVCKVGFTDQKYVSVDKKNQLDVTFCVLYFSSNSCSTCFG